MNSEVETGIAIIACISPFFLVFESGAFGFRFALHQFEPGIRDGGDHVHRRLWRGSLSHPEDHQRRHFYDQVIQ